VSKKIRVQTAARKFIPVTAQKMVTGHTATNAFEQNLNKLYSTLCNLPSVKTAAKENNIPIQYSTSNIMTGTDTDAFSIHGIPSALLSVSMTNMHTPIETLDPTDMQKAINLYFAIAKALAKHDFNFKPLSY
jgi:acetylornithine deacetylase/succinyl-diaminopimelate desuccinylase-like protein